MFAVKDEEKWLKYEKGNKKEILEIKGISKEYQKKINEYSEYLEKIIKNNINLIKEFYNISVKKDSKGVEKIRFGIGKEELLLKPVKGFENIYEKYQILKDILSKSVLDHFNNCPRLMYSIERTQFFVLGKEISNGVFASTDGLSLVYWGDYYFGVDYSAPGTTTKFIGSNGQMNFKEWYYESNIKIRIVKQIRDEEGKYCGELAVDFYKFDDYDKLFDKNGKPG